MILGRELYRNIKIGCCGQSRYDIIFPVEHIDNFMHDAKIMVRMYYNSEYNGGNDKYSLEYFEGTYDQTTRGSGRSYYGIEIQDDGKWHYFENDVEVRVYTKEELLW